MHSNMLTKLTGVVALLCMLCGATAGWGEEHRDNKRPDHLTFEPLSWNMQTPDRIFLANGTKLYHHHNAELPLIDITLMFGVGRSIEDAANTGLLQLFGRALENGGTHNISASDFDAKLDSLAINLSVDTGPYTTTLQMSLLKEDLQAGMELLAQLVRNPGFEEERFATARQQLLEQVRRRLDNPGSIAGQLMLEHLYPDHPLGRQPTLETLAHITRADLLDLHQRYFGPENMYVAVSGDIAAHEAMQLMEESFSTWEQEAEHAEVPALKETPGVESLGPVIVAQRPLSQTTIRLVERGITQDNPDVYAVEIMNFILGGGGFNSRLMREIRSNRGLAYSVFSHFSVGRRLQGAFYAGCETKAESVEEAVNLFASIMQDLRTEGVTAEELQLAKQSQINSFVFRFENSHSLVTRVMEYDFFGYPEDYLTRYRDHIGRVTVADVQRVAQKYLHPQHQAIILVGEMDEETIANLARGREVKNINPQDLL